MGDPTVISKALGERHKVRIVAPDDPNGDVTVDTQAVGAAWLQPTTGISPSVYHDLQTTPGAEGTDPNRPPGWAAAKGSAIAWIRGTYPLYADAYRLAAKDLGLKPREVWTTADALAFGTRQSKTEHRLAETEGPFRMSRTGALRPGRPPGPLLASLHCPHRPRYVRAWGFHIVG